MSRSIEEDVLRHLKALPADQQQRVLDFTRTLGAASSHQSSVPAGVAGKALLHFAGTIELGDLRQMAQAVEEECERVDASEWQLSA